MAKDRTTIRSLSSPSPCRRVQWCPWLCKYMASPLIHRTCWFLPQILRMEVSLRRDLSTTSVWNSEVDGRPLKQPLKAAEKFFTEFPQAKIVFVIDTHSLEDGRFLFRGHDPITYESCYLEEVIVSHFQNCTFISQLHRSSPTAFQNAFGNFYLTPRIVRTTTIEA